jgi:uncharacterized phiE125 gp8 family phage protein
MAYKKTVPPATEPFTLAEAKNFLQIDDFEDDDDLITALIEAVRIDTEEYLNRCLIQTTIQEYFPVFEPQMFLSLNPVLSIDEIIYTDQNGTSQTLTTYQSDLISEPAFIAPTANTSFPSVQSNIVNPIRVTYKSGFGTTADDIPKNIKQAMLLMLRDNYDNRENPVRKMRTAAQLMLQKIRMKMF